MAPGQHTGIATMDADLARGLARCQCFNVMLTRKCSLGASQALSDKISEHPEFGAARGCRSPAQDQGAERLVWRERTNHNIASLSGFRFHPALGPYCYAKLFRHHLDNPSHAR